MSLDRRRMLALMASAGAFPGTVFASDDTAPVTFRHGVASGDPLDDRVVLWTRVTPDNGVDATLAVHWEVAEDRNFIHTVASGTAETSPARDYTVKVDAAGLLPGRDYVYRFRCNGALSPPGRTRTLPKGRAGNVVLVFVSCALYPAGYFNAYDAIAKLDRVDAVVALGDYIYEYGAADSDHGMETGKRLGRIPEPPHEIVTLADYRTRHALYKRDADLQAAHARCPWICVWDDHEVSNDDWVGGAANHQPKTEGSWRAREASALRAYYEWMPIRDPERGHAWEEINRSFQFGDLATLVMLETRLVARSSELSYDRPGDVPLLVYDSADPARRKPVTDPEISRRALNAVQAGEAPSAPYVLGPDPDELAALLSNPERRMMNARQELWLEEELTRSVSSGSTWQVLGNQVVMARTRAPDFRKALGDAKVDAFLAGLPDDKRKTATKIFDRFSYPVPFDLDSWDGYPAARERVYDAIKASQANAIVVSGDSHSFWANELSDAHAERIAVEFGTTSVTSPSAGDRLPGIDLGKILADQNREVVFCDEAARGFIRLTLSRTSARADFIKVDALVKPYDAKSLAAFEVKPRRDGAVPALTRI